MGTLINVVTILIGGTLGSLLGNRLPERTRETVMNGLGLCTLVIGLQMALTTRNVLVVLISLLLGALLGEWWGLDDRLNRLGEAAERRFGRSASDHRSLATAFVTASLVFCVGPMAILGAVQDGLTGDYHLLAIKAVLDGFTAMAFAASLGPGVLLSAVSVAVYQGALTLAALALATTLAGVSRETPAVIEMTATGGVLIMGIGLVLLELRQIRLANLLPAVAIAPMLVWVVGRWGMGLG